MINTKLISHRGNIIGKNPNRENSPQYINEAIDKGFDVEIDIRSINGSFYLGHDNPDYLISINFLEKLKDYLWIHCKNIEALSILKLDYHCFFHNIDDVTLTSRGYLWTYPGKELGKDSICVMPELSNQSNEYIFKNCVGICSDTISIYKNLKTS
jgi:hypothetical protein